MYISPSSYYSLSWPLILLVILLLLHLLCLLLTWPLFPVYLFLHFSFKLLLTHLFPLHTLPLPPPYLLTFLLTYLTLPPFLFSCCCMNLSSTTLRSHISLHQLYVWMYVCVCVCVYVGMTVLWGNPARHSPRRFPHPRPAAAPPLRAWGGCHSPTTCLQHPPSLPFRPAWGGRLAHQLPHAWHSEDAQSCLALQ